MNKQAIIITIMLAIVREAGQGQKSEEQSPYNPMDRN